MQIPSIDEVLKCGDVWPEPSVSVATLRPPPHFASQNKHGSFWTGVISVGRGNTGPRCDLRSLRPRDANATSPALQQLAGKHGSRCSGGRAGGRGDEGRSAQKSVFPVGEMRTAVKSAAGRRRGLPVGGVKRGPPSQIRETTVPASDDIMRLLIRNKQVGVSAQSDPELSGHRQAGPCTSALLNKDALDEYMQIT
ncbi:hypothetical protein Q5P01_019921 [Channa striata]|uniref:Uncharacterized protein n=1 Tax=Channa striata TaxID=64152 RepID=A0AA88M442_CHASR|nr:hypothetical protein Q5P01_019921 [Channa striata]